MDLDLDLDTDLVTNFLQSQLNEVKLSNAELEKSLHHRQNVFVNLQQEIDQECISSRLQLNTVWKKLFNNKYIFGVELKNENDTILEDINVILDWNSPSPLIYKFYLISSHHLIDGITCTDRFKQFGQIVITLEVPFFVQQLDYTITVAINFEQDSQKRTLKLPSVIQLRPQDVFDNSLDVQIQKVIDGSVDDFLACVFASEKHEFVMVLPNSWTRMLETALEIDCSLCRINVTTNKKFFVAHRICSLLDGALVEIENDESINSQIVYFNFYCKNQNVLQSLIHYLHNNLANITILPKSLFYPEKSSHDVTQLIKNSLLEELDRLEAFSDKNLVKFRSEMAVLEHKTDVLISSYSQNTK